MFMLKKMITPFLLPPGIFIFILLVSGLWLLKKSWKVGLVNIVLGFFLWFISISPVGDALMRGLEADLTIPENPRGDVIILLGGGIYDDVPDLSGRGAPSEDTLARIVTAVRLQRMLRIPIIVCGGTVFPWRRPEAPVDARMIKDLGVPSEKIIIEDKSRDTLENARCANELCKKYHFRNPLLVTSAYHTKRAVLNFKNVGMDLTSVPSGFKTWKRKYGWYDYLPSTFGSFTIALREYIGLLYHKVWGE